MGIYQHAKRWAALLLSLRRKFPGKGFVRFGQMGVGLVTLSVLIWFPGIKETVIAFLIDQAGASKPADDTETTSTQVQLWLSIATFSLGSLVTILSLIGYLRFVMRDPPGLENNGAISVNVQPNTGFESLVRTVAQHQAKTVDFKGMTQTERGLTVLEGPILATDFQDFLDKACRRVSAPGPLEWRLDEDVYRLSISNCTTE